MNIRITQAVLIALCCWLIVPGCTDGEIPGTKHSDSHAEHEEEDHGEHAEHRGHEEEGHSAPKKSGGSKRDEGRELIELRPGAAARVNIQVTPVEMRQVAGVLSTTGRVAFNEDRRAHISPRIPGRVHKVHALLGQEVEPGTRLAVIDSIQLGEAKTSLLQARSELELAERTLKRDEGLLSDKISSEQSVLQTRNQYQKARAQHDASVQRLRLLGLSDKEIKGVHYEDQNAALFTLRSPIKGTVVQKHASLGEMVTPETGLYTVVDLSRLWVWIDLFERDLGHVHIDDDVLVTVAAHPGRVFRGKVGYISDQVNPGTRTARARVDVSNPNRSLKAGMFASITLIALTIRL